MCLMTPVEKKKFDEQLLFHLYTFEITSESSNILSVDACRGAVEEVDEQHQQRPRWQLAHNKYRHETPEQEDRQIITRLKHR